METPAKKFVDRPYGLVLVVTVDVALTVDVMLV